MRYWQTNSGSPASTPTRQSNSVGRNFCASSEIGLLEQLVGDAAELLRGVDLVDAARERAVGNLHHQRQAEFVHRLGQVARLGQHHGRRRRHLVLAEQLHQEHLVGAADHRDRIVDDRHALLPGAAREAVGVVVDRGGLADEQAVVFGEFGQLPLGDRLDVDRQLLGDARHVLDRGRRRRRHLLVRIVQHREVVLGDRAGLGIAPFALGVLVQRLAEELALAVGQPVDVARPDAVDRQPLAGLDRDLERRAAEPVEQQPAEGLEARVARDAEADQQLELAFGLVVGRAGRSG